MPEAQPTVLWGADHAAVLALTVVAAWLVVINRRRLQRAPSRLARRLAASLLLGNELIGWAVATAQGHIRVPLQLCDLAMVLTVWALWRAQPAIGEVAYFWGLGGSLQAILTPDVRDGFPDYWWIKFFIGHCGVVLSVIYLAAAGELRPTHRSVWRMWGLTNLYAAVAGLLNAAWGTNYGYLARKPSQPSLLDYFGPWPYYIVGMELVALASFYVFYAPWAWSGRRAARQPHRSR